jgi:hypothetical protein
MVRKSTDWRGMDSTQGLLTLNNTSCSQKFIFIKNHFVTATKFESKMKRKEYKYRYIFVIQINYGAI